MKASENPFRSSSVEQIRYALPNEALAGLVDQALSQSRSCLLGPKGTGKTTLLEDLEPRMTQRGLKIHWARLQLDTTASERAEAVDQLAGLSTGHACLFDGAEVLNWWQWLRVCKTARSNGFTLIATLHRKRGLPILMRTEPDWPLVAQFVQQLSGAHCSDGLLAHAEHAFQRSHGNMREVFRACYLALASDAVDMRDHAS
jgi:ABC-type phosphate/phosphonate transport system ATPase subunit